MKTLSQHIAENIVESKALHQNVNITEKLRVNKNYKLEDEIIELINSITASDEQDTDTWIKANGHNYKLSDYILDMCGDHVSVYVNYEIVDFDDAEKFLKKIRNDANKIDNDRYGDGVFIDIMSQRFTEEMEQMVKDLYEKVEELGDNVYELHIIAKDGEIALNIWVYNGYKICTLERTDDYDTDVLAMIIVEILRK